MRNKSALGVLGVLLFVVGIFLSICKSSANNTFSNISCRQPKCYIGVASYYGANPKKEHLNENTAMNIPFNAQLLEAAMWDVPLGSVVRVTNLCTKQSVIVRITDRGPAKRLKRVIDLTYYAFSQISFVRKGLIKVKVEVLKYAKR